MIITHRVHIDPDDANGVLSDYYGFTLDPSSIAEVFESNLDLTAEYAANAYRDTMVREMLITAVEKWLGMSSSWPTYGATKEYKDKYYIELQDKLFHATGQDVDFFCEDYQE